MSDTKHLSLVPESPKDTLARLDAEADAAPADLETPKRELEGVKLAKDQFDHMMRQIFPSVFGGEP